MHCLVGLTLCKFEALSALRFMCFRTSLVCVCTRAIAARARALLRLPARLTTCVNNAFHTLEWPCVGGFREAAIANWQRAEAVLTSRGISTAHFFRRCRRLQWEACKALQRTIHAGHGNPLQNLKSYIVRRFADLWGAGRVSWSFFLRNSYYGEVTCLALGVWPGAYSRSMEFQLVPCSSGVLVTPLPPCASLASV